VRTDESLIYHQKKGEFGLSVPVAIEVKAPFDRTRAKTRNRKGANRALQGYTNPPVPETLNKYILETFFTTLSKFLLRYNNNC